MIVRVTRFGERMTRMIFDLDYQTNEFKAYMKNQKEYVKDFRIRKTHTSVIIHTSIDTKEDMIRFFERFGKGVPYGELVSEYAPILLGY